MAFAMKKCLLLIFGIFLILDLGWGQSDGDFRSKQNGLWRYATSWEVYDGNNWIDASSPPDANASLVTIQSADTITFGRSNTWYSLSGHLIINGALNLAGRSIELYGTGITNNGSIISSGSAEFWFSGSNQVLEGDGEFIGTFNDLFIGYNDVSSTTISTPKLIHFNYLDLTSGSTLILGPDSKITNLTGYFFEGPSTLIFESNSSSSASVIFKGTNGSGYTANYQKYLTSNAWHTVSSPLAGQSITSFLSSNPNIPIKSDSIHAMEYYNEGNGDWEYITDNNQGSFSFNSGRGYLARVSSSGSTVTFTGTLNSGSINTPIVRTHNGWNCVGNPYPSSLGVTNGANTTLNFLDYNTQTSLNIDTSYAALYLWNGSTYTTINNTDPVQDYIQPGQGFLVKAMVGASQVTFTPGMQTHGNPTFYKKSAKTSWGKIILSVSSLDTISSTKIYFREDMTKGLDVTYDAGLFAADNNFSLYTRLVDDNGIDFMIQCLPSQEMEDLVIPVGLNCTYGGILKFGSEVTSLPAGYKTILEDRQLGVFTDLSNHVYEVQVDDNTSGTGRFFIHTQITPNDVDLNKPDELAIFAWDKEIMIKGNPGKNAFADLYTVTGVKIGEYRLQPSETNRVAVNVQTGIYIFKVRGEKMTVTNRIFIK